MRLLTLWTTGSLTLVSSLGTPFLLLGWFLLLLHLTIFILSRLTVMSQKPVLLFFVSDKFFFINLFSFVCSFLVRDRKGVNPKRRGGEEELERMDRGKSYNQDILYWLECPSSLPHMDKISRFLWVFALLHTTLQGSWHGFFLCPRRDTHTLHVICFKCLHVWWLQLHVYFIHVSWPFIENTKIFWLHLKMEKKNLGDTANWVHFSIILKTPCLFFVQVDQLCHRCKPT